MSEKHQINKLGNEWHTIQYTIASAVGAGDDKHLYVRVRFDGNGTILSRFVVSDHGEELAYGKFDAAVDAYNSK